MKKSLILASTFLLLILSGCSLAADVTPPPVLATQQASMPQATAVRPAPTVPAGGSELERIPADPPDPFSGALTYAESCAPCHGPEGRGDGEMTANLEVPVPPLGDPDFAYEAVPADWFEVVTLGRMDRFMPPFRSLTDAQRWDVVAFALGMSSDEGQIEHGQELYQETCAGCHGADGRAGDSGSDLTSLGLFAERSITDLTSVIELGAGEMPAFGDEFDKDDRQALAAYIRTLAYQDDEAREPTETGTDSQDIPLGSLLVTVKNGTQGAEIPDGLDVQVVAFDGDVQSLDQRVSIDDQGRGEIEDLEIVPGRIYGAVTEYQGVQYFSTGGHMLEEDPRLELDLTIYEPTADIDPVRVDRLHVIFDYAVDGIVEVSELWLVSNSSDRTVVQEQGSSALPVALPQGFGELRFGDEALAQRVTPTEDGFLYHEPIRPGEQQEVIFTFTLPYERSLNYVQPIDYPVDAVVLLTEENAPELSGSGLQDEGTRPMGDLTLHTYTIESLEPGSTLALNFRGRHPAASSDVSTTNLLIGAGVLVLTLAVVLFAWQTWLQRGEEISAEGEVGIDTSDESTPDREALLLAIAGLDDAFEAGDIAQEDYERQRAAIKAKLIKHMQEDDD
ncbi:MAG: c-type cytochrome [Anaerolineales bacterium]